MKIKLESKYGKYLKYYLKQNNLVKHFFLLNSANVTLFLSTISDVDAQTGNQNSAGPCTSFTVQSIMKIKVYINRETHS